MENIDSRVAIISLIVDNDDCAEKINALLHEYKEYIIGRMGVPYRKKNISIISVIIDASLDVINALSGKIGKLSGVSVKTVYSK